MQDALGTTEREVIENVRVDTTLSGSTGVMVAIRGDKIVAANVGDSRAVLGVVSTWMSHLKLFPVVH